MEATATSSPPVSSPSAIVVEFLEALQRKDPDGALELLADDAQWINVSLPTIRPKRRIERIFRLLDGPSHFRVHFHNVAEEDGVVLTERTDALGLGRFEQRFWVYGRFELRDGKIAVWRDSFDWLDLSISLVRGLAGIVSPALNRRWPG